MPETAKLLRAVVEIGTQLRRLADANTTDVAVNPDTPTTTPDNGRRVASWLPISPELAAQRAETWSMLERYIDGRICRTPETHNWGCGCPTDQAPAAHTQTLRWARRESLLVLLTRVQHGRTLTDDEARTLRHHVETEMREADIARERAARAEVRASACREDAEDNATRAERAEQQRDKLTILVRDIFASFTTVRSDGKVIGYQGPNLAPDQFEDWHDRAHDPASDLLAADEQPGPAEQCRAQLHGNDPVRRCIRPAHHTEDHAAGDGWHWLEDIAIYPTGEKQQDPGGT